MSGWQQPQFDPSARQQGVQESWGQQGGQVRPYDYGQPQYRQDQFRQNPPVQQYQAQPAPARPRGLTAAGSFWYVLGCIPFGAMYFCKVPAKKALDDAGICEMTSAEKFWYVLQCIAFGAGYFAKLPVAKALSEIERYR
jgi:hypothetical protein